MWRFDSKRALDLVLGSFGLLAALPVFAAAAAAMRASGDRGPFLYRARRIGRGGRPITVFKIRTMVDGASGPALTMPGDPRVTRVGAFLRRHRIDELPQLIDVVRGDMSLVGPRPEDPAYVDLSDPLHRLVFTATPGMTGLAQLAFHAEDELLAGPDADRRYREEVLPAKLRLDARYLATRSTLGDLRLLWRTARTVLG